MKVYTLSDEISYYVVRVNEIGEVGRRACASLCKYSRYLTVL